MGQHKTSAVSKKFRDFRNRTGISQEDLGEQLGVSGNYIYLIESNRKHPSDSLQKLFSVFEEAQQMQEITRGSAGSFAFLETDTLVHSISDVAKKLPVTTGQARKRLLSNVRGMLDELERRERFSSKPLSADADRALSGAASARRLARGSVLKQIVAAPTAGKRGPKPASRGRPR